MFVWVRLHISNKIKTNILGEKNVENNNKSNGRKLLKMMYTCICVQMCSKSCSLATNTRLNKKRHSYNSGDSLGGHKSKDDHRKSEPAKKHTHTHYHWLDLEICLWTLLSNTHAKKQKKNTEKINSRDRNRIRRYSSGVNINEMAYKIPNAYSCLIRKVLHILSCCFCIQQPNIDRIQWDKGKSIYFHLLCNFNT